MDLFPHCLSLLEHDVDAFCVVHYLFRTELDLLIDTEGEGGNDSP